MDSSADHVSPYLQRDDIASLKQHLPGGKFDYVDVAAAQAHANVLLRWPLLAETNAAAADPEPEPGVGP
jgi:hypothetical protein